MWPSRNEQTAGAAPSTNRSLPVASLMESSTPTARVNQGRSRWIKAPSIWVPPVRLPKPPPMAVRSRTNCRLKAQSPVPVPSRSVRGRSKRPLRLNQAKSR
jgi:hypothetical protein